jgi:hypothetical protein
MNQAESVTASFGLLTETLSVSNGGSGVGTVTSSPAGIDCGSACSVAFTYGATVTLTATPAAGSSFTGWSGACTGTGTCTVTMDRAQSVTATFGHKLGLSCVVPRVTGKKLMAAERALGKAHCRSGKIRYRYSRRNKGEVISQMPHPGKHLRNGARVTLIVSTGRRR